LAIIITVVGIGLMSRALPKEEDQNTAHLQPAVNSAISPKPTATLPKIPPPKFRLYKFKVNQPISYIVPINTTDEQLKSLLWLFRQKIREGGFSKIGISHVQRPGALLSRPDFSTLRASLADEIARFRTASQEGERRKMQREFEELDDRLKLAPLKSILKNEVARLIYSALLDRARADCDTTWITRKGGEAAQAVVTARLRSDFAGNLMRLGFAAAPVEIKLGVGTVGQHPYRLALIAREDVPPSEVLSEGEKTCVALAGFVAELETTNNGSGIVLDDPVSSLDHHYRLRVARLLVDIAKQRQVVVFTHDIVFLIMLTKYARIASIPLAERTCGVEVRCTDFWRKGRPGWRCP
jgi:hypothetical protein